MEKKVHFNNISTFMEKRVICAIELTVRVELPNHPCSIEQLFFAQIVKNNKVDPFN